jgi:hypothetical protein
MNSCNSSNMDIVRLGAFDDSDSDSNDMMMMKR